ncbi:MAG: diguanylate cyclase, partial [Pigmentiphaga sp.]
GAGASLSVALRDEYGIRALLVCHARAPNLLPHAGREAVRVLTEMTAQRWFLLRARTEAQYLQRVQDSRDLLSHGRGELREPEAIVRHHGDEWLALFRADGLALVEGPSLVTAGRTPSAATLGNIAGWLREHAPAQGFWAGHSRREGPLAPETEVAGCAGLLAIALPIDPLAPGWLLMFRHELRPSIRRVGPAASTGRPAAIWYEQPFGQSEPWLPIEQRAARDLAEDLAVAAAAHRISVLNVYLAEERLRLAELNRRLERQAHTDPLTGIWNRYRIEQALDAEVAAGERYGRPCAVLIFDVDHFKRINDTYGHSTGDGVLAGLAGVLRETLRPSDHFGRWGGEEFIAILSHTSLADGLRVAERLRARLAEALLVHGEHVTTSIGVATWQSGDDRRSLLERADRALYRAKRGGRNRVCPEDNNIPRFPEDL